MLNPLEYNAPPLADLLSAPLMKKLRATATQVTYDDGELIHNRGDDKPGVSIVRSGAVSVGTIGADGSFHTVSSLGPGQCFGEHTVFTGLPRTHDVLAVGKTRIEQISGPAFLKQFEVEPELAKALLINSLSRSHALLERLDDMRRLSLPVRTAKYLMSMSLGSGHAKTITCTQTDLAFAVGVSRISLGKALRKLEALGLISAGYGQIEILGLVKLEDWIDGQRQTEALTLSPT